MNRCPTILAKVARHLRLLLLIPAIYLLAPSSTQALTPLPEVGVDYQQMKITDPKALQAQGMQDARTGDPVKLDLAPNQEIILRNLRTGQSVTIQPAGHR